MLDDLRSYSSAFQNRRVFVTGHTGFKGSWLSTWLTLLGAKVTGYALPPERGQDLFTLLGLANRMRHVEGDIRDGLHLRNALETAQPEFVFHLAAQPLVLRSYQDPKTTFDTNVGGSVNLLEAVRGVPGVRVLIYVTSDKCYRNEGGPAAFRETDPLGGHDPYSASKACAELVLASYQASFFRAASPRIATASVRAGNVIGGGDWADNRILPDCIRALGSERPIVVRNADSVRPWQHVLDALSGYLQLAACLDTTGAGKYDGAWNFGPGAESHRSVGELVDSVLAAWGCGERSANAPGSKPAEAGKLYLNCEKARSVLGWRPAWDFEETVKHTVDWYRRALGGSDIWGLTARQIEDYSARLAPAANELIATGSVA